MPLSNATSMSVISSTSTGALSPGRPGSGRRGEMGARSGEHARDLADQMAGHVDHVAADVGAAAAARDRLLQPPGDRHRRVEPVVVEEMAAVVDDLAELAGRDQLPGEGGPGPFAIDEAHLMRPPARGRRPVHGLGRLEGVGERLFAEHVLALGEGVLADLGMGVVGRQHQHEIDVGGAGHVPPVPAELPPAPGLRGPLAEPGIEVGHAPPLDRGQVRRQPVHGAEREGIGARHEAAADHANPDRRHPALLLPEAGILDPPVLVLKAASASVRGKIRAARRPRPG